MFSIVYSINSRDKDTIFFQPKQKNNAEKHPLAVTFPNILPLFLKKFPLPKAFFDEVNYTIKRAKYKINSFIFISERKYLRPLGQSKKVRHRIRFRGKNRTMCYSATVLQLKNGVGKCQKRTLYIYI